MSIHKRFIFFLGLAVVFSCNQGWSQAARSPFTTYGIGESYGNALVHNQGMAGVGVSQPQYWFLNNQNPALLVYNTLTVFQVGAVGESRTLRSTTQSERNVGGNLNYLATAFPIKVTRWTTSLGLMPYTTVDYNLQYEDYVRDNTGAIVDTTLVRESGSGGLTQFYWSNGVRINRMMSIGLKATYLFGAIDNIYSNFTVTPNQPVPFLVNVQEKTFVSDFIFGVGYSFSKDSLGRRNNYRFSAGVVYNFGKDLKARKTDKIFSTTLAGDTVYQKTLDNIRGIVTLPPSITAGISLSKSTNWSIGTEFNYQDWSSFRSINRDDEGLGKSWRISLGGELTPDATAVDNYLKRLTYRTGVSMEQYPFLANGEQVKDFGINFGLSMPAGRSSLDFAFKVGKRGNRTENILDENYFKVYFGITFNDQWFIKRKFD